MQIPIYSSVGRILSWLLHNLSAMNWINKVYFCVASSYLRLYSSRNKVAETTFLNAASQYCVLERPLPVAHIFDLSFSSTLLFFEAFANWEGQPLPIHMSTHSNHSLINQVPPINTYRKFNITIYDVILLDMLLGPNQDIQLPKTRIRYIC